MNKVEYVDAKLEQKKIKSFSYGNKNLFSLFHLAGIIFGIFIFNLFNSHFLYSYKIYIFFISIILYFFIISVIGRKLILK